MGNIIGEVFDEYVSKQITGRQIKLGLDLINDDSTNQWKFNNSAWVRMISSIDISQNKAEEIGLKDYAGSKLAQNFILYNGVSSVTENNENFSFNPASSNQEYFANDPAFSIRNSYGFAGFNQGIRPMPGIESVKVGYINRGFLANVDIELTAYNREQLYIIDALFLHPGYTFLLEWGHTRYIDNETGDIIHIDPDNLITDPFEAMLKSPNPNTQYTILDYIQREKAKRSANYDAFFGIVKNFQYSYQPNGTYKITIKGVTQGDVAEGLKANTVDPARVKTDQQRQLDEQARAKRKDEITKEIALLTSYIGTDGNLSPAGLTAYDQEFKDLTQ